MTDSAFSKPQSFHERRSKGIGGSEIASILGISPYRTAHSLWLEKTGRQMPDDISNKPHVIRGILGEEVCRAIIERDSLKRYLPKTWQGAKEHWLCSDDGYQVDDNEILEIKCMGKAKHEEAASGLVPEYYLVQCQWNLLVSGAARCWFVSFRPEDETMHKVEVLPDPTEQARIAAAVDNFWLNHVVADIPPGLGEGDVLEISRPEFIHLVKEYEAMHEQEG
jgi:putative phage-type endonuclease